MRYHKVKCSLHHLILTSYSQRLSAQISLRMEDTRFAHVQSRSHDTKLSVDSQKLPRVDKFLTEATRSAKIIRSFLS